MRVTIFLSLTLFVSCIVSGCPSHGDPPWNVVHHYCGDGILDPYEDCDDGWENSDVSPNGCRTNCTFPRCGDKVVDDLFGEECEPSLDPTCTQTCTLSHESCTRIGELDPICTDSPSGKLCIADAGAMSSLRCGCDPEAGNAHCDSLENPHCDGESRTCVPQPVCGVDLYEPNQAGEDAFPISWKSSYSGVVCSYDDDWYSFTTPSHDATLLIDCHWEQNSEAFLRLAVTDCQGATLAMSALDATSFAKVVATNLPQGSTYCLQVRYLSNSLFGLDEPYQLRFDATPL